MTTFVSLINLTDQGIRNVKESPHRFEAFKEMAAKHGLAVKSVYYTVGQFDMIVIIEGSEQSAIASLLATNALGNIRSQTMLAYSVDEMKHITAMMP
ncbi:MAG: GYD domain-containing protein [Chromatiaceae bacterium]|nr:GYD domain-containing protein [Gammaproteobacteria bacterium]MCP5301263.1 GYD domain-containing protein [Chromatiaceae bacterium]MCP5421971.1 GYD domain-containing protein [Chromatiaceae bacterium]